MTESNSAAMLDASPVSAEEVRLAIASIATAMQTLAAAGLDTVVLPDGPLLVGDAKCTISQSEARFRHLINRMGGFVAELRGTGEILYLNEALINLFGLAGKEFVGLDFFAQLKQIQERPRIEVLGQAFLGQGELWDFRTALRGADGLVRTVVWNTAHVAGSNAASGRVCLLGLDITGQVMAEEELRVAAIAFESQEGMVVTDVNGTILRVNNAFTEITGYSAAEAIGKNPNMLKSGHHNAAFYIEMWDELLRNGSWQGELWNRRKSGEIYPEWMTITAAKAGDGSVAAYVGASLDITLRKEAAHQIERLAFYDPLTELANRRLLLDRLRQSLAASSRRNRHCAVMLIDLDNFKSLNDTLGHDVGDSLLIEVARRLITCVREGDTVARFGGDEFVVILEDLAGTDTAAVQAEAVAIKIQKRLSLDYMLALGKAGESSSMHSHHCTSSIGIALYSGGTHTPDDLIKSADLAMYRAKAAGRNTMRFFDPQMQANVIAHAAFESELRDAVAQNQFVLVYQPQVDTKNAIVSAESLVRWMHPVRGLVSPGDFIGLAEDTGLIIPLGSWVMRAACEQLVLWRKHPVLSTLSLAVNVSARQFHSSGFVEQVISILEHTGADPKRLKLELTESVLIENVDEIVVKMQTLKRLGISFSLDDFGTGYSSLAYLRRLPIDELKIDQSFVHDVLSDANDAAIARTVLALGQSLGLKVIAEGVETAEHREFLAASGCQFFQGYLFGRPLSAQDFVALSAFVPLQSASESAEPSDGRQV
jgi:diguanylate cyclase (GGDEF)-like protein/PAS domain S-box-containing protein